MVAEDGKSLCCQGTCRNVEHAREKLAGDFIHIGDHQQETLRCGVGGGEGTGLQRAVNGTGGTGFALHLDHFHGLTENVFSAACTPFVNVFGHRRRRGDRIDGGHFAKHVGYVRSSAVTVACHEFFFCHITKYLFFKVLILLFVCF